MATVENYDITGKEVRSLMRMQSVTIRALALQYGVTLKRIREVRKEGVRGFAALEWHYLITGVWLDLTAPGSEQERVPRDSSTMASKPNFDLQVASPFNFQEIRNVDN